MRWVHRGGVLLVGCAAAALGGFVGFIVAYLLVYECEGVLCVQWVRDLTFLGVWGGAMAGPLLGMIWSLNVERWRPLWIGIGASAALLVVLFLMVP
jgi:hypothetical protein